MFLLKDKISGNWHFYLVCELPQIGEPEFSKFPYIYILWPIYV